MDACLVLLLILCKISGGGARSEGVVAASVQNVTDGVVVSTYRNDGTLLTNVSIPGLHLSSQRCQDIFIDYDETAPSAAALVYIPVRNAIAVVATNTTTLDAVHGGALTYRIVRMPRYCDPVTIFRASHSLFAVCVNVQDNYFNIISMDSGATVARELFPEPQNQLAFETPLRLSNHIVADASESIATLYLVSGAYLYRISPLLTSVEGVIELADCSAPYNLVYADESTLLAACMDRRMYLDVVEDKIINETTYAVNGYQHICQDADLHVKVTETSPQAAGLRLNATRWSTGETTSVLLMMADPYVGLCFGLRSGASFAYANETGAFAVNVGSARTTTLHASVCDTPGRQKYHFSGVFQSKYLLISHWCDEVTTFIVVDTDTWSRSQAFLGDMAALFSLTDLSTLPTVAPSFVGTINLATAGPTVTASLSKKNVLITILGVVAIVVLLATIVVLILIVCFLSRRRTNISMMDTTVKPVAVNDKSGPKLELVPGIVQSMSSSRHFPSTQIKANEQTTGV